MRGDRASPIIVADNPHPRTLRAPSPLEEGLGRPFTPRSCAKIIALRDRSISMTSPAAPELEPPTPAENPEMHLPEDFGPGSAGRLLFWIAVAFATFQIVTAFGIPLNRDLGFGVDADPHRRRRLRRSGRRGSPSRASAARRASTALIAFLPMLVELHHPRRLRRRHAEPGAAHRACRLSRPARRRHAGAAPRRTRLRQGALVGARRRSPSSPASITGSSTSSS